MTDVPAPERRGGSGNIDQSLTSRTFTGLFWMFGGSASQAILRLGVLIVMARLLSPAEFGLVGAALVVISLGQICSRLGIGPAIVQRPELSDDHLRAGFILSMALALLIGGAVYLGADGIASFFRMDRLAPIVQLMALIFPIAGFGIVAEGVIQRQMRFKELAGIELGSYLLGYGAIGIVLAALGFGVWSLVIAQLAQAAAKTAFVWVVSPHPVRGTMHLRATADIMNFGAGFSIAKLGNSIAQQADNLVVGRWLGAEALGLYSRAYSVLMMPANLIGAVFDKVLFPAMASVQHDRVRLTRAYRRAVTSVALITLPASGFLIVIAPELIILLLGEHWVGVILPLQVLAIILVFRVGYKLSDSLARAMGAVYRRAWRQWVYAAAVLSGAWLGHFFGLGGVAAGVAIAVALNYLLMLQLSVRLIGISWFAVLRSHLRPFQVAVFTTSLAWLVVHIGRHYSLHEFFILLSVFTVIPLAVAVLHLTRVPWLDEDGRWMMARLFAHIRRKPFIEV